MSRSLNKKNQQALEDNMSKSLTESLINEGIRALQELQVAGGGAAGSRTGGPVAGTSGLGRKLGKGAGIKGAADAYNRATKSLTSTPTRRTKDRGMRNAIVGQGFPRRAYGNI